MNQELGNSHLHADDSINSCLIALKEIILSQDDNVTCAKKYGMPFFSYKGKMFCYLWVHKKYKHPYIGIVEGNQFEHPDLIIEKRLRMKVMLFDPNKDLPLDSIEPILRKAIDICRSTLSDKQQKKM